MLVAQKDIYRYIELFGGELDADEVEKILRVSNDEEQNGSKGIMADELVDILLWIECKPSRAEMFANYICSKVKPGSKILEVGCGPKAKMARKLMKRGMQVTAIDPLLKEPSDNFRREYFTLDYDVAFYDVVVGLEPCEAIEPLIRVCIREKKPFIAAPCGQPHQRLSGELDDDGLAWWNYLKNLHPKIELKYLSIVGGYVIPAMSLYV
ncbi:MAG: UPF0146 family protein [Candidatus Saccharibacteria bacterium]|nr:UPF0146 family protein [Candidatus Saccharibacteria bacterium]